MSTLRFSITFLFFLMAFFLHAQEEEKSTDEQNSSRRVLFDLSKQKAADLVEMCVASAKGKLKPTKYSEGSIFAATSTLSIFSSEFKRPLPSNVKLCIEGTVFISDSSNANSSGADSGEEESGKLAQGIRVGFKTGTSRKATETQQRAADASHGMSIKLFKIPGGNETKNLAAVVFSGPLPGRGIKNADGSDLAENQVVYTSKQGDIPQSASEAFRFKMMADEQSKEISLWINEQQVFTGKSAYDGVEGEMCPFHSITGFWIRFESQQSLTDDVPAYVKNVVCYYLPPESK